MRSPFSARPIVPTEQAHSRHLLCALLQEQTTSALTSPDGRLLDCSSMSPAKEMVAVPVRRVMVRQFRVWTKFLLPVPEIRLPWVNPLAPQGQRRRRTALRVGEVRQRAGSGFCLCLLFPIFTSIASSLISSF